MKLSVALEDYGTSARHDLKHAQSTYYNYSGRLMQLSRWLAENGMPDPELHDISHETLRRYYLSVINQGVRPRTQRSHLHAIKSVFGYYHKNGAMPDDPSANLVYPRMDSAQRKLISDQELQLLLEATGRQASDYRCVRDRAIIAAFVFCALRRQDVLDLRPEDVNLDEKVLIVQKGKGGKSRQIPLCKEVHQALGDWIAMRQTLKIKSDARLFTIPGGRSLGTYALSKIIKEVAAIAGLKGEDRIQPHSMRHAAATRMLRNGMDVQAISTWLGHGDIKTTNIYLHIEEEQLRPMAELAGFQPKAEPPPATPDVLRGSRRHLFRSKRTAVAR
jgi:integrase/recombinase XerD